MEFRQITTKEKALEINLNQKIYGSFAEIGAGQEVAANFFKAGGASGTIAKTMSAYDMKFSDVIYGKGKRYVCENRLIKMLNKEYSLLIERLPHRHDSTCFFAFADTVETLNFKRTNQGHGWIGVRFQNHPTSKPNDCVVHILMHDNDMIWQQQAIGEVGVNLLHACFYHHKEPEKILTSLMDNLQPGRIEVDMFRLEGPCFTHVDNRLLSLKLVKHGMSKAAMFGPKHKTVQPNEALYKKNILLLRGRFRPVTHVNLDMLKTGKEQFVNFLGKDRNSLVTLSELTLHDLKTADKDIDEKDFLDRADILCDLGQTVMVSDYPEYYKLVMYLSKLTTKHIGLIMGIYNIMNILDEKYYHELEGGLVSSFGLLFGRSVKLYIYPYLMNDGRLLTCKNVKVNPSAYGLFRYLQDNSRLEDISGVNQQNLHIISDNVLAMIKKGGVGWEKFVPEKVVNAIKKDCLFDYPCKTPS